MTNTTDAAAGSLRAQVIAAAATGDTIDFQAGLTGTITLTTGQISITKSLTITGPGASSITINGNTRIFNVNDGAGTVQTVTISGLTLTNANSSNTSGGAIINAENLTI